MLNYSNLLMLAGSLCVFLALVLAWSLVGVRCSSFMFRSYQYLLKAQVDYLMMSGLLIVFFRSRPAALFDFWVQSIESQRRNIHETT